MDKSITIRNGIPDDYERIIEVMPDWWNGRDLTGMVLKIFTLDAARVYPAVRNFITRSC